MRDTLPRTPWDIENGVVNLNLYRQEGSHWVAYRKYGRKVYYFDPFGDLKPFPSFVNYCNGCDLYYNHQKFQKDEDTNCGQLCLKFLLGDPGGMYMKL